ncbi:bifunctional epoxide hydrolase 2-like [Leptonychotes weddellii]|uniref:Bifunctional epoxide hydrolase 2-like n=1 Tax=Leptonychotes weddellii TaxID=9713 RepID=A0A7F8RGW1_LEPWE|nr:bifunctional epoxide hydrolase 2-like [Leptonychotes weddellii]
MSVVSVTQSVAHVQLCACRRGTGLGSPLEDAGARDTHAWSQHSGLWETLSENLSQKEPAPSLPVPFSFQLFGATAPLSIPCNPSDASHGYVPIKPGVRLHFVELGSGPAVCLCHGFPESWFSWRYQIPALAQAGFRVLALDMKGYGESSAPPEIEEYSMEVLCQEIVTFLDKLGIPQAVFIGHDWGGMLVWNMALFYPERVRAVASLNTPFIPANPNVSPMERIKANPVFDYQLYFQEPGVAEAELEQNLSRTFKSFFRASDDMNGAECISIGE